MEQIVQYKSFEEARAFVRKLNLKNIKNWEEYRKSEKRPQDIPSNPYEIYKNKGWISVFDFFGFDETMPLSYEETSSIIQSLNIRTVKEYSEYISKEGKSIGIPKNPKECYKGKGWSDWETFFNKKEQIGYKNFLPFEDAKKFTSNLNLKNQAEWKVYCKSGKKPSNIPNCPEQTYKPYGWKGWSDFLGKENRYKPYNELKLIIQSLKLNSKKEYEKYVVENNITDACPKFPDIVYKNKGWESWWDFLGKGISIDKSRYFMSYDEAKKFVQSIGVKTYYDWLAYVKSNNMNNRLPKHPHKYYVGKGWKNWKEFFGTDKTKPSYKYRPFEKAKEFVQSIGIKNSTDWRLYCKTSQRPKDIPSTPNYVYKNSGWNGWNDFSGQKTTFSRNPIDKNVPMKSFEEAKKIVQSMNIKNSLEWNVSLRLGKIPDGIPRNPNMFYEGKGWKGFKDFFGREGGYKDFLPFEEAKKFVHGLKLKSQTEWFEYTKSGNKPKNIPTSPSQSYKEKGWTNWNDFLGKD